MTQSDLLDSSSTTWSSNPPVTTYPCDGATCNDATVNRNTLKDEMKTKQKRRKRTTSKLHGLWCSEDSGMYDRVIDGTV